MTDTYCKDDTHIHTHRRVTVSYERYWMKFWDETDLWIYFAWCLMFGPQGSFGFSSLFLPPLLFCLASHKSIYAFGQLPSYLLLHSNCHRRLLIAQPHLVCHVCSPPPNILFSIPQPECSVYIESTPLTFSLNSKTEYITFIPLHFAHYSVNLNIGFSPAVIRLPLF